MNKLIFVLALVGSAPMLAQMEGQESLLRASFEGMFDPPEPVLTLPRGLAEPQPPVPLDGGLVMLLLGGIAVARRRQAR